MYNATSLATKRHTHTQSVYTATSLATQTHTHTQDTHTHDTDTHTYTQDTHSNTHPNRSNYRESPSGAKSGANSPQWSAQALVCVHRLYRTAPSVCRGGPSCTGRCNATKNSGVGVLRLGVQRKGEVLRNPFPQLPVKQLNF